MKKERIKSILLVTHELSMTGAPIALLYLGRILQKDNIFVTILSPEDGKLREDFTEEGFTLVIDSSITGSTEWLKWANGFDLIVVNTVVIFHLINQLSESDIPVIWWIHDGELSFQMGAAKVLPLEVGSNVKIVCPGQYTIDVVKKYRNNYSVDNLIYCVPDFAEEKHTKYDLNIEKGKLIFLNVGSIDKRKGQDLLVNTIRRLPQQYFEQCCFVFVGKVGDQDIYNEIMRLKEEYPEHVKILGQLTQNEVKNIYRQVDAVVCTSRDDPMPVFLTEAMISSKPVICSYNTGTYSLIKNKENGFCFENQEQLLDSIEYFIDCDAQERNRIGKGGRQIYEKYFTESVFRESFYQIVESI